MEHAVNEELALLERIGSLRRAGDLAGDARLRRQQAAEDEP